ncbi:MAG: DnaJ domain-containing protein [Microcystaceae cyanobacterium]
MAVFPIPQGLFKYEVVDHHAILGAPLDADFQQIRKCYLKIAYQLHPDTCKAESEANKKRATKYFSRLVNPAYEALSRDSSRTEHLLIATQTAKNLKGDISKITLTHADVRDLFEAKNNLDLVYRKLLNSLVPELYKDLEQVLAKVAHLSEINLIYLLLKSQAATPQPITRSAASSTAKVIQLFETPASSAETPEAAPEVPKMSSKELSFRRAQTAYDRGDYNEAIAQLRDVLKLDPKNSQAHCLLGMSYLKSNMLTMAKVHINTASELTPYAPQVVNAKRELEKSNTTSHQKKTEEQSQKGGLCGGLFGGKKK